MRELGWRIPVVLSAATGIRNSGASVSSVVNAQTVTDAVASKRSSWMTTTGRGLPAYARPAAAVQISPRFTRRRRYRWSGPEPARLSDAGYFVGLDEQSDQRCVGGISRERADGHRCGGVEAVVLDDDDGSGLADVSASRRSSPDLASIHSSLASASMNAWSSAACRLDATASDCWCACSVNCGDLTSGTQIWMGRRPCSRSR